jgi:hypothetical protein
MIARNSLDDVNSIMDAGQSNRPEPQGEGAACATRSHKTALTSAGEVDTSFVNWLKQAYDQAG